VLCLPPLADVDGTLAEIGYGLETLGLDGVVPDSMAVGIRRYRYPGPPGPCVGLTSTTSTPSRWPPGCAGRPGGPGGLAYADADWASRRRDLDESSDGPAMPWGAPGLRAGRRGPPRGAHRGPGRADRPQPARAQRSHASSCPGPAAGPRYR
jgi:hypothetical protein